MEKQLKLVPDVVSPPDIFSPKPHIKPSRALYDTVKNYNGVSYSGMQIGGTHNWLYKNGIWNETKLTPDKWKINFKCEKHRMREAPQDSGAGIGSGFNWFIIADQKAIKRNENVYSTEMNGLKFKVGHKRPQWKNWSYNYPEQPSYKQSVIQLLEEVLKQLRTSDVEEFYQK
jgi:hypothetical protein